MSREAIPAPPPGKLLWSRPQIAAACAFSVKTLERLQADGKWPPPDVTTSKRLVRWKDATVREAIDALADQSG